ncbi:hypothetical protein JNW91_00665 [Micromonospora sp. STR1_7]|uniref:Uncharacterized protein n=1 Tax=Micromonospora parastrephiae TaxID=2806101 RepID=A0ABS1XMS5_9ACTN|nr:hypothetical protein [Micromonospora parastrephiae]MBM0230514.1 hypothetical protein [Micromonospora parastrephiae]
MRTIADFRRAAVPDSIWLCINRRLIGGCHVVGFNSAAGVLFTDRYAEHGQPEAVAFPADVEVVDRTSSTTVHPHGITARVYRITKTEARRRWHLGQYVAVSNERHDDGTRGYAMRPGHYRERFPTFDAMVEASTDTRRPTAVHFSKPLPMFDLVADASAAESTDGRFWIRVAVDAWLWIHPDATGRPCRHTHDTATMLQSGDLRAVNTHHTPADCERVTAELIGGDLTITGTPAGTVQMNVADNTGGFLTGIAERIGPFTVHLLRTSLTRPCNTRTGKPDPRAAEPPATTDITPRH